MLLRICFESKISVCMVFQFSDMYLQLTIIKNRLDLIENEYHTDVPFEIILYIVVICIHERNNVRSMNWKSWNFWSMSLSVGIHSSSIVGI